MLKFRAIYAKIRHKKELVNTIKHYLSGTYNK